MSITRTEAYTMLCGCKVTRTWEDDVLISIDAEDRHPKPVTQPGETVKVTWMVDPVPPSLREKQYYL